MAKDGRGKELGKQFLVIFSVPSLCGFFCLVTLIKEHGYSKNYLERCGTNYTRNITHQYPSRLPYVLLWPTMA